MPIRFILTDIEGTTTSVAFVYDVLFPYFKDNIVAFLRQSANRDSVQVHLDTVLAEVELPLNASPEAIGQLLIDWTNADRKHGALKAIQGVIWKHAYEQGTIKGHVYPDVVPMLQQWQQQGIGLGVYSSGSIAAQKLLFGFSEYGDMTPFFSHYFDTTVGPKRESASYEAIANALNIPPSEILFLSDVPAELDAAREVGFQTIQLLRPGIVAGDQHPTAIDFASLEKFSMGLEKLSEV
jgi:enolase-phosphatase E1